MRKLLAPGSGGPEVFAEPQRLDIVRAPSSDFAFGAGMHDCLGTHLARLAMTIALDAIMRRMLVGVRA